MRKSPIEVARLIVANALKYADGKGKPLRRFTMPKRAVRAMAKGSLFDDDPYWNDLSDALLNYDHVMLPHTANDTKIAVMHKDAIDNWLTLSAKYSESMSPSEVDKLLEFWETEPYIADGTDPDNKE